jgi:hypothetical protein
VHVHVRVAVAAMVVRLVSHGSDGGGSDDDVVVTWGMATLTMVIATMVIATIKTKACVLCVMMMMMWV